MGDELVRAIIGRGRAGIAALTVLSLVMAVLAFLHKGVPASQLQLNDGGVWVTNQTLKLVAHLNYPSRTLDGGVRAGSGDFDVSQDQNTVVVSDATQKKAQNVDTAAIVLGDGAPVGGDTALATGGQVAAVTDAKQGKAWVLDAANVSGFRGEGEPVVDKMDGVRAAVGTDGVVHLVDRSGAVKRVQGGKVTDDGTISGLTNLDKAQLTVVGDTLVVFDQAGSSVRTTKGSVQLADAAGVVVQQVGPSNDKVLLAGPSATIAAPLGGGAPTVTPNGSGAGVPAAPVYLDSCAYYAWGGSGTYVRDCPKDADDDKQIVDKMKGATKPAFRVNRDVIVFNDLANGLILLVNDKMIEVDNWAAIDNSAKKQDDKTTTSTSVVDETIAVPCSQQTNPPQASDDAYGVRPGRTYTLPVLENDTVPNCTMLTASVKTQPTGAKVSPVRGGEALSISVPDNATGTLSFVYTASDGHGNTSDGHVKVTVNPASTNEPPKQTRLSSMTLGKQGSATTSVLGDWSDPEGDTLFLVSAAGPGDLLVRARPDGVLTVRDLGTGGPGDKFVTVTVSDGVRTTEGKLKVTVKSDNLVPPIANTDHVSVLKGEDVVVRPLANDIDPNGGSLRLTTVQGMSNGQNVQPDYVNGTFRFSSTVVGTTYLTYQVASDSPTPSTGTIRVDVNEPAKGEPIAADDIAMLPVGGTVVVDALANDTDPAGGVLVLKSVAVAQASGLAVEVLDHHLLRVSAPVGITTPVDFTYVVSNGSGQALGHVAVVPLPPTAGAPAPIAANDKATVRLGDIATIAVLNNDQSPAGLPLSLDPKVTIEGDASVGDVFVSRDVVRYRAKKAGTFRVTYTVHDTAKNISSAQIVINVTPLEQPNTPPLPQPLEGRVLAGGKVIVPVPMDGVDPDGDSVTLVGIASAPSLGAASATNDSIEYTAPVGALGTDTFTYTVQDRFGAQASSTVRVGIAPPNTQNQDPVAVPDDVSTRPNRMLTVKPISNDVDPDGDTLSLVANSVAPADATTTVAATTDGDFIDLKTPETEGNLTYYYEVSDGRGGHTKGVVTIHVSKDALLKPPIGLDDVVTPVQIKDQKSVTVDVLANDYDPDGSVKELVVSTSDPGASVGPDNKVTVAVTDQRQVILYTITDMDKNTGKAAIIVPPAASEVPSLNLTKVPVTVEAGKLISLPLSEYVIVRGGHSPLITFEGTVKAGVGADPGTAPVKDARTLQFRSVPDYAGLTSVTFEVTDGSSADDPAGRKATLSLPIKVIPGPAVNHPPTFTPSEVTVAAGEPAKSVDLKQMAKDPDPGDQAKLSFTKGAISGPFKVDLAGSTLNVSADAAVAPGTSGSVQVSVSDGTNPPVPAVIQLKASASTRPLMAIKTAVVSDAKAGSPSAVDLSQYITNPFAAEKKPVTIVGTPSVSVAGAQVAVNGLNVTVTPAANTHGSLVVTYTAQDATQQPSRQVRGTIELTVRDKPDAPIGVTGETHLSRTVTLTWTSGANNGAPIDYFTVKWTGDKGGTGSQKCAQVTTCTIASLVNDETYKFRVSATNLVGEGPDSTESAGIRPDVKPNPPGAPVGTFGDKQIALTWPAATTDGSPVTSYTVEISPAAGGTTQSPPVTGTSYTWTGLTNGVAYTFRVQAHSAAPQPSDWSLSSAAVVPAGVPFQPAAPNAAKESASTLPPAANVSWSAPNGNGDSNFTYEMRMVGTSTVLCSGTATSCRVTLSVSSSNVSFQVRAKNKAGWSDWSGASNAIRPFQDPGAVGGLSASPTGTNNQVKVTFSAAAGNGATSGEMTYYWRSSAGGSGTIGSTGGTLTSGAAFPNGTNVTLYVWAQSVVNGETAKGPESATTVNAYGPPVSPSISCSGGNQSISCSWSGGNDNGRSTTYVLSNAASGNVGPSGSTTVSGIGYSATRTVCIQAVQSTGLKDASNCASATSDPKPVPPPSVSVSKGASAVGQPGCSTSGCAYIVITTANFNTNVSCSINGNWAGPWTLGGNQTKQVGAYYGYTGTTVTITCSGGGQSAAGSIVW